MLALSKRVVIHHPIASTPVELRLDRLLDVIVIATHRAIVRGDRRRVRVLDRRYKAAENALLEEGRRVMRENSARSYVIS